MSPRTTSRVTTDHDQILCWAEQRGAKPATVAHAERVGDSDVIRLTFPGERQPRVIGWPEWFRQFEKYKLALLYQEELAAGELSRFHQIISRGLIDKVASAVGGRGRSATSKSTPAVSGKEPTAPKELQAKKSKMARTPPLAGNRAVATRTSMVRGRPDTGSSGTGNPRRSS